MRSRPILRRLSHQADFMKTTVQACGHALLTAFINSSLALALMLLVEFTLTGTLVLASPYLWAGLFIWIVIFTAQFYRQLKLCRTHQRFQQQHSTK